jgi:hypothetical protein
MEGVFLAFDACLVTCRMSKNVQPVRFAMSRKGLI